MARSKNVESVLLQKDFFGQKDIWKITTKDSSNDQMANAESVFQYSFGDKMNDILYFQVKIYVQKLLIQIGILKVILIQNHTKISLAFCEMQFFG